jgi:hypothetical protein
MEMPMREKLRDARADKNLDDVARIPAHGTLRHSSSSIVGLPHIDARLPFEIPSLMVCLFYFHSSFLWSPVCINFNPGCYHLFLPLCCMIAVIIRKSCSISPRSIHLLHFFHLSVMFISYTAHTL